MFIRVSSSEFSSSYSLSEISLLFWFLKSESLTPTSLSFPSHLNISTWYYSFFQRIFFFSTYYAKHWGIMVCMTDGLPSNNEIIFFEIKLFIFKFTSLSSEMITFLETKKNYWVWKLSVTCTTSGVSGESLDHFELWFYQYKMWIMILIARFFSLNNNA